MGVVWELPIWTISTDRLKDPCEYTGDCADGFVCEDKKGAKTCQLAVGEACKNSAECAGKDYYGSSTICEPDDGESYCCIETDEKLPEGESSDMCCSKNYRTSIASAIFNLYGPAAKYCIAPKS